MSGAAVGVICWLLVAAVVGFAVGFGIGYRRGRRAELLLHEVQRNEAYARGVRHAEEEACRRHAQRAVDVQKKGARL